MVSPVIGQHDLSPGRKGNLPMESPLCFWEAGEGFNGDGEERIRWERAINVALYKPPVQYYNVYDIFIGGSGRASKV